MEFFLGIAVSAHLGLSGNYNGIHPNIGIETNNISIGAYYNSESNISNYVSYEFEITEDTSLEIGAVDGYKYFDILPFAKLNHKNFFMAPAIEKYNGKNNIGLIIGLEFKR